MLPEEKIPPKARETRFKAVNDRRTSNHHAGDGFKMFPAVPRYLEDPKKFRTLIAEVNSFPLEDDEEIRALI